jgi:hypothetical protein
MSSEDGIWAFSKAFDPALKPPEAFTTFNVRINELNDVGERALNRLNMDWSRSVEDGAESKVGRTSSSTGCLASLIFPESVPERFDTLSYFNELGFLHDGMIIFARILFLNNDAEDLTDPKTFDGATQEENDLSNALSMHDHHSDSSPRGLRMRKSLCPEQSSTL